MRRSGCATGSRNRFILTTAAVLPIVFLVSPTAQILALKATAVSTVLEKRVQTGLFLPLLIPVFVPAIVSAYAVVGEREQETLEPVLTTPVTRVEFLLGKAAAIFLPAVGMSSTLMSGIFVAITPWWPRPCCTLRSCPPRWTAVSWWSTAWPCSPWPGYSDRERLITGTKPSSEGTAQQRYHVRGSSDRFARGRGAGLLTHEKRLTERAGLPAAQDQLEPPPDGTWAPWSPMSGPP